MKEQSVEDSIKKHLGRYADEQKQRAYMSACACLYAGYGMYLWDDCGVSENDREEIWNTAKLDVGEVIRHYKVEINIFGREEELYKTFDVKAHSIYDLMADLEAQLNISL